MSSEYTDEQIAQMAEWRLLGRTSCVGCSYMYFNDTGYSNYTVLDTDVHCALDKNPLIDSNNPPQEPFDWAYSRIDFDNWPITNGSRCPMYCFSIESVHFDVDGEKSIDDYESILPAVKAAIVQHRESV
jgi:hypothetical protein